MSLFFSEKYKNLTPYTPGEQPKDTQYVKLNTNESPFPPSPKGQALAAKAAADLQLYSDPECTQLVKEGAKVFGVEADEILFTNGSDEILNFAFMAFCDESHPAVFPDITYGFYKVFAQLNNAPFIQLPLQEDFSVKVSDYIGVNKTVFIANPNAPTGIALSVGEIEEIIKSNPHNVVVIDEAYVDFGGETVIPLIHKYDNLLVIGTFSKSRSLAGGRLGFAIGCRALIQDLNTIKYSTNPYNINRMTMAAGVGVLQDEAYTRANCAEIIRVREWTVEKLREMGFILTESKANFLFAKHPKAEGKEIYLRLKQKGVLVRHFDTPRLKDYNRITVGSQPQMETLLARLAEVLEELQ
ncbi:MAG: histidinol-phosphate transaminase [Oscillospiraceae bacterium]|nr:histidinol-phosphate transaminase [Oscillospiraceae bacterium]